MATIADQPDIEVVGEVQNESDLADIVEEQVQPDVLIIAMDDDDTEQAPPLARVRHNLRNRFRAMGSRSDHVDVVLLSRKNAQQGFAQQPVFGQQENCGNRHRKS